MRQRVWPHPSYRQGNWGLKLLCQLHSQWAPKLGQEFRPLDTRGDHHSVLDSLERSFLLDCVKQRIAKFYIADHWNELEFILKETAKEMMYLFSMQRFKDMRILSQEYTEVIYSLIFCNFSSLPSNYCFDVWQTRAVVLTLVPQEQSFFKRHSVDSRLNFYSWK